MRRRRTYFFNQYSLPPNCGADNKPHSRHKRVGRGQLTSIDEIRGGKVPQVGSEVGVRYPRGLRQRQTSKSGDLLTNTTKTNRLLEKHRYSNRRSTLSRLSVSDPSARNRPPAKVPWHR